VLPLHDCLLRWAARGTPAHVQDQVEDRVQTGAHRQRTITRTRTFHVRLERGVLVRLLVHVRDVVAQEEAGIPQDEGLAARQLQALLGLPSGGGGWHPLLLAV